MPPTIGESVIDYVDLDIDVIVWPDGRIVTVDAEEFESNAAKFRYPEEVKRQAFETLLRIQKDPYRFIESFRI